MAYFNPLKEFRAPLFFKAQKTYFSGPILDKIGSFSSTAQGVQSIGKVSAVFERIKMYLVSEFGSFLRVCCNGQWRKCAIE